MATESLVESLAKAIGIWFPELGGRSIAVSEVDPFNDKTNIPTLPIAVVALIQENAQQGKYGSSNINLSPDLAVEFIFEPTKYTLANGAEAPFYSYYNYEDIRDRLLTKLLNWRTPRNGGLSYKALEVDSDEFAVYISFRFTAEERWCPLPTTEEERVILGPVPMTVSMTLQDYRPPCCDPACPCTPEDPCAAARARNPFGKEYVP